MSINKPLKGYKVIELSTYIAAPTCGRVLADWGAEVIKVEAENGDTLRTLGIGLGVTSTDYENPLFDISNSGKKDIIVNLKTQEGMEILHGLLADADVFLTNMRLKPLKKMGLDYEDLKEKYPRLIYAIITGFGDKGPDVDKPGFDMVAFWGSSGFLADMSVETEGSYPVYTPSAMGDICTGTILFGGIAAALLNREKTGLGDRVTISLYGAAVWLTGFMDTMAQYGFKYPRARFEGNPMTISYKTKDGEWLMLTILEHERYFPALCKVLGVEEIVSDPRFLSRKTLLDLDNRKALIEIFEKRFITKNADEWVELLIENDIVHDRLKHFREIPTGEQAVANDYMSEVKFPSGNKAMLPRPAIQSQNLGLPEYTIGPRMGENTMEILKGLGYDDEKINKLIKSKVVMTKEY